MSDSLIESNVCKQRDLSLDMAKGLLMSVLIIHHFGSANGIDCAVVRFIEYVERPLLLCYFMQTFFMITGMCSNFDQEAKTFLVKQIKTLLWPAMIVSLFSETVTYIADGAISSTWLCIKSFLKIITVKGGLFWFLCSLCCGKVIYYFLYRITQRPKVILGILLGMSCIGTALNDADVVSNYWWHRQTLDMSLYIGIGHLLKEQICNRRVCAIAVVVYVTVVMIGLFVFGWRLPYVTAGFGTSLYGWPFHVVMAISGSLAFLWICKMIKVREAFVFLGQNSLIIYMTHGAVLFYLMHIFADRLNAESVLASVADLTVVFWATITFCALIAYVVKKSWLRVILGKW